MEDVILIDGGQFEVDALSRGRFSHPIRMTTEEDPEQAEIFSVESFEECCGADFAKWTKTAHDTKINATNILQIPKVLLPLLSLILWQR